MSRFFLEILDFKYPKADCLAYSQSITEWKPNVHYAKQGIDTVEEAKWFDHYPDQDNNPLIKQITSSINLTLEGGAYKFVKTLAGGSLPFHIDPHRECVFMLPLTDDNAGLQWAWGNKILCEHVYKGPTVINAKIMHGVPTNNKDRIFLQVSIPCTWNYLINHYKEIFNL